MKVQLKNAHSYLWRTLMTGRNVIEKGCIWRIESGENIDVWMDRWVHDIPNCSVSPPIRKIPQQFSVLTLIDKSGGNWKHDFIFKLFNVETVAASLKTLSRILVLLIKEFGRTLQPEPS